MSISKDLRVERHRLAEGVLRSQPADVLASSIVASAPDAVIVFDESGAIREWNARAEALFGWSRDEALLRNFTDTIISPQAGNSQPIELKTLLDLAHGEQPSLHVEVTAARRTGEEFTAEITVSAIRTESLRHFCAFVRDITARFSKARSRDEQLRLMIDVVREYSILTLDAEGLITSWNSGAERITGYRSDDILGRSFSMFHEPETNARGVPQREMTVALATGRSEDEGWRVRKDGTRFWASAVITALRDEEGRLLGFLKIMRDLTERRRIERRLQATVESAPTAMVMIDRTGCIVLVNVETERLFGYSRDELLGQAVELLVPQRFRPQHPGHRAEFFANPIARRMGMGRDLFGVRKDGSEFPVELGLNPIETEEGLFVLSAIVDITQRKLSENEMLLSEQRLASANDALVTSNTDLERFAYVASHDLQEPLRKISSYAQLLRDECGESLSRDGNDYLVIISNGAQRMKTLIDDLLSFSRISKQAEPLVTVDANVCLRTALDQLEMAIRESKARITFDPLPPIRAVASQLCLVFQNLIGNAIKYRGDAAPEVHVGSRELGEQYEIFIRDNGIGIDQQFYERIFQIFQRLHNRRDYSGTGIGLSICKRIVERFGGRIWLDSKPGIGSTFYFTIDKANPKERRDADE